MPGCFSHELMFLITELASSCRCEVLAMPEKGNMHTVGIALGIVALLVAIGVGLVLMLAAIWFVLMTAAALMDWSIRFVCFLFGLTTYTGFLRTWHDMLFAESSSDAG